MEQNNRKPLIFICIPNLGSICPSLVERLIIYSIDQKYNTKFYFPSGMLPLDNARNHCVNKFLELSNHEDDRLWFIDHDIIPPLNGLDLLMKHNTDIVGLLCFMMKPDDFGVLVPLPIAMKYNQNKEYNVYFKGSGLTEVDALGGGCIMIKRRVFEEIGTRCYQFHYYPDGTLSLVGDYSFCQLAQSKGFKIYVDFDNLCGHIKNINLLDINNLLLNKRNEK
jgi:hypothetical protein